MKTGAPTYSLRLDYSNSENYYKDVKIFADEILDISRKSITPVVKEYCDYLLQNNLEELREEEEYILELLSFGVLWRTYAHYALSVKFAPYITLSDMGEWRKKHHKVKPYIDFARGILISLLLLPKRAKRNFPQTPTLEKIDKVCTWFEATGEFREQALRFIRWRAYWGSLDAGKLKNIFSSINLFTTWFEHRSIEVLGKYTQNVDNFLEANQKFYKWREDRISCTRSRIEYHLNMAGAELMNRAFRKEFKTTEKTAVLLPGCMRTHNNNNCKAAKEEKGLRCAGCTSECGVNGLRILGEKNNFDVYIIPHASDLSLWSPRRGEQNCGIIASACVTTLVEGGWELKRYDVPAQCVLLDCSGCKKHWHREGIPTVLNNRELRRILEYKRN